MLWFLVAVIAAFLIAHLCGRWYNRHLQHMPKQRRQPDPERLQRHGLPVLATEDELAAALGFPHRRLTWLLDRQRPDETTGVSRHYVLRRLAKRGGGERLLLAPKRQLKDAQRWILRTVLDPLPLHEATHGFRAGRSILTNAAPHAGQEVVVCCDLKDFFPTISYPRVRGLFQAMGYGREVASALALLCTTRLPGSGRRVLPQGAPTSPALANLIAQRLDRRFAGLAHGLGFTYTRYADDCTFSGSPRHLGTLIRMVKKIVHAEGFRLHPDKLRIHRKGARQQVTGLVVNATPSISRAERRRLRAILHQAQTTGLEAQNREGRERFADYLRGKIAFLHMVNPRHARPLAAALVAVSDDTPSPAPPRETRYAAGPEVLDL